MFRVTGADGSWPSEVAAAAGGKLVLGAPQAASTGAGAIPAAPAASPPRRLRRVMFLLTKVFSDMASRTFRSWV
jgi:hypothetical protein